MTLFNNFASNDSSVQTTAPQSSLRFSSNEGIFENSTTENNMEPSPFKNNILSNDISSWEDAAFNAPFHADLLAKDEPTLQLRKSNKNTNSKKDKSTSTATSNVSSSLSNAVASTSANANGTTSFKIEVMNEESDYESPIGFLIQDSNGTFRNPQIMTLGDEAPGSKLTGSMVTPGQGGKLVPFIIPDLTRKDKSLATYIKNNPDKLKIVGGSNNQPYELEVTQANGQKKKLPIYGPKAVSTDNFDHVKTQTLQDNIKVYSFEDLKNGGDKDFNDEVVRIETTQIDDIPPNPEPDGEDVPPNPDPVASPTPSPQNNPANGISLQNLLFLLMPLLQFMLQALQTFMPTPATSTRRPVSPTTSLTPSNNSLLKNMGPSGNLTSLLEGLQSQSSQFKK